MDVVSLANERVGIGYVCGLVGVEVPESSPGRSVKVRCPFGFTHRDHGLEAAFRVYFETNTAFCFAGCGFFTPVWLAATAWDRLPSEVARDLLEGIGYGGLDPDSRWEAAQSGPVVGVDRAALVEALQGWAGRTIPDWERRQFGDLAPALQAGLGLVGRVEDEDGAWLWLDGVKKYLVRVAREGSVEGVKE